MPGFFAGKGLSSICLNEISPANCVCNRISEDAAEEVFFVRNTLNKFMEDKFFGADDKHVLILEGYLLNKNSLFEKYGASSIYELMTILIEEKGETFFAEFRGCFSGLVYDKQDCSWTVFTNQIGDNPVFYYYKAGSFSVGSQVNYLLDWCAEQKNPLSLNESCAYQMLTYGFVPSDETYAQEIKRLKGGEYILFKDGKIQVKTYHRFIKDGEKFKGKSETEIIEELDAAFKKAVDLEWKKDKEYNLQHLADLSGGLDSRMNVWVAHELNYSDITLLTYSKAGYLDETIAETIAASFGDELLFKPLDDASFMYDIGTNTFMLGGLSLYSGITGGRRLLLSLKLDRYGLEHTGMVGDIVLGSMIKNNKNNPTGMYSEKLKDKVPLHIQNMYKEYDDYEVFLLYSRGFRGACNTHLLRRNYTETGSPFLNVDFFELCLAIPQEMRMGHYIYKKWMIEKYHDAAQITWEKTGGPITESRARNITRRIIKKGFRTFKKIIKKESFQTDNMNPLDYWIGNNASLKEYLDSYERNGYDNLPADASPTLIADLKKLYKEGTAMEKSMVLTVLSAAKLYFSQTVKSI